MMKNIKNNFIHYSSNTLEIITILTMAAAIVSPFKTFAYTVPMQNQSDGENVVFVNSYTAPAPTPAPQAQNPVPTINSITPTTAVINSGSQTMTVTGTNFVNGSIVRIDGTDRTTTYVSSTKLTAELNYADTTALGTHTVNVFNPGPGGGSSNKVYLNIKPTVGSVLGSSTKVSTVKHVTTAKNTSAFQPASESDYTSEYDYGSLTSSAVFGGNTFMPTGLMQWILFAILILLIVIIVRKIFVGDKHAHTPLKHA